MRVFISADIEGVGGVATWDQASTKGPDHARARQWMTDEVNAAVDGALQGGATDVVVRDAHGSARNILWESLHPRAKLISGWGPTGDMMHGIDSSFGVCFLIGYHPSPATPKGVLSHTFTSRILDLRLNGAPCNEATIAAMQAGLEGVPIGLVSGQSELWEEIRPTIGDCIFVPTKQGLAYQAAVLEPAEEVRSRLRDGAREAVAQGKAGVGPRPFRPDPPLRFAMELQSLEAADALVGIDGISRVSAGGCTLDADDARTLLNRLFTVLTVLYSTRDSG